MRIHVDRELCIGSEVCVDTQPDAFSMDSENVAVRDEVQEAQLDDDARRELVLGCPSGALYLTENDGTRVDLD